MQTEQDITLVVVNYIAQVIAARVVCLSNTHRIMSEIYIAIIAYSPQVSILVKPSLICIAYRRVLQVSKDRTGIWRMTYILAFCLQRMLLCGNRPPEMLSLIVCSLGDG